jgi:hypothetical protein
LEPAIRRYGGSANLRAPAPEATSGRFPTAASHSMCVLCPAVFPVRHHGLIKTVEEKVFFKKWRKVYKKIGKKIFTKNLQKGF